MAKYNISFQEAIAMDEQDRETAAQKRAYSTVAFTNQFPSLPEAPTRATTRSWQNSEQPRNPLNLRGTRHERLPSDNASEGRPTSNSNNNNKRVERSQPKRGNKETTDTHNKPPINSQNQDPRNPITEQVNARKGSIDSSVALSQFESAESFPEQPNNLVQEPNDKLPLDTSDIINTYLDKVNTILKSSPGPLTVEQINQILVTVALNTTPTEK